MFSSDSSLSNRRYSAHPVNEKRQELGEYHHLFQELKKDEEKLYSYTRMSIETFNYILNKIESELDVLEYNNLHTNPILAEERLVLTLRYLATGSSFRTLAFSFRMGASTVSKIVYQVCNILWTTLQPIHMRAPTTSYFLCAAEEFERLWDFPNCIGSLDGKHVRIKCPAHSGSMFYNYKSYFSIVLQGLVDGHYRFISIDVGGYGKQSDGGTFSASTLSKLLENNKLGIPSHRKLPSSDYTLPYVFIADEAYPLKENLMKPYSGTSLTATQENFNKRLSRARKTAKLSNVHLALFFQNGDCCRGLLKSKKQQ
ncbi:protein ALP1-like [Photinus pyralis]|uniref:protein ALP1-like n=1 Tax=Photinus pyralis TaxID=7054 RepID=UPI0012670C17|nr:protein ALP1-like [Photinus pyralis]